MKAVSCCLAHAGIRICGRVCYHPYAFAGLLRSFLHIPHALFHPLPASPRPGWALLLPGSHTAHAECSVSWQNPSPDIPYSPGAINVLYGTFAITAAPAP